MYIHLSGILLAETLGAARHNHAVRQRMFTVPDACGWCWNQPSSIQTPMVAGKSLPCSAPQDFLQHLHSSHSPLKACQTMLAWPCAGSSSLLAPISRQTGVRTLELGGCPGGQMSMVGPHLSLCSMKKVRLSAVAAADAEAAPGRCAPSVSSDSLLQ